MQVRKFDGVDFLCYNTGKNKDEEGIQTMGGVFEEYGKEMLDKGVKEGAKKNLLENVKALMSNLNFTIEQAMDALSVPLEERDSVKSSIALP